MTLKEWSEKSNIPIQDVAGCVCVADDYNNPLRLQLWRLSDYFVSSVMCGSIWLQPRGTDEYDQLR